jgi:hypothetical protein
VKLPFIVEGRCKAENADLVSGGAQTFIGASGTNGGIYQ